MLWIIQPHVVASREATKQSPHNRRLLRRKVQERSSQRHLKEDVLQLPHALD